MNNESIDIQTVISMSESGGLTPLQFRSLLLFYQRNFSAPFSAVRHRFKTCGSASSDKAAINRSATSADSIVGSSGNTEDLMGDLEKRLMLFYPLLLFICIFGNGANLIIYQHKFLRNSTTIRLLAAKALANMISLLSIFPNFLKSVPRWANNRSINDFYWNALPFVVFNTNTFATFAIWLTVTMSLERYVLIAFPVNAKSWCTMRNVHLTICATFICSICLQLPGVISRRVVIRECYEWAANNQQKIVDEFSWPLRKSYFYTYVVPKQYKSLQNVYYYSYSLTTIVWPVLVLVWTTLSIHYHLFSSGQSSRLSSQASAMAQKRCVMRLSFVTTLCHLAFETAHFVVFFLAAVRTSDLYFWRHYEALTSLANFLSMLNGALPFFIYVACSQRFRKIALASLLCRTLPTTTTFQQPEHSGFGSTGTAAVGDQGRRAKNVSSSNSVVYKRKFTTTTLLKKNRKMTDYSSCCPSDHFVMKDLAGDQKWPTPESNSA